MNHRYRDPSRDRTSLLYREELQPPKLPKRTYLWRRVRVLAAIVVVFGLLGTLLGYLYLSSRLSDVRRVNPAGLSPAIGPMTVLLVGSDSRAGLAPGQESHFGSSSQVAGERSDAIMILRTDAGARRATVLSVPRDLYLPIAGTGKSNRINTAYAGGPERLIATIETGLGISINHYVEVNFDGFRGIVEAIGGLNVFFPAPARDILSELSVPSAGCVHLNGQQGLAYVRSRHYEFQENGKWTSDPTGDIGRITRQQDFIRRMIKKAVSKGVRNPVTASGLIESFVKYVTIDRELSTLDLARLGVNFRTLGDGGVEMLTLPTTGARVGGSAVLRMKQPEGEQAIEKFLNPPPPPEAAAEEAVAPSEVRVQVLNGTGRTGEASSAAGKLQQAGFRVAETGDATTRAAGSVIRYGRNSEAKAKLLQGFVVGGAEVRSDTSIAGSDLVLVTGRSFAGIKAPAAAPPATKPAPAPAQTAEQTGVPDCPA